MSIDLVNLELNEGYVRMPEVCWTAGGYSAEIDYDIKYLGFDRVLSYQPEISLEGVFDNDESLVAFMDWWNDEGQRADAVWVLDTIIFGKFGTYGIRQTSQIKQTSKKGINKITFKAEVVMFEAINNNVPVATPLEVFLEEDSRDNFIVLHGVDEDKDYLTFDIEVGPAWGVLSGSPPNMLFTPTSGYKGDDCFTFTVSDEWSRSTPATVAIHVGTGTMPSFIVEYQLHTPADGVRVGGNYWVDTGLSGWKRGTGGWVIPDQGTNQDTIRIASYDNNIDNRDKSNVKGINIDAWGSREDFSFFCQDMDLLEDFAINSSAGTCQATNAYGMFRRTPNLTAVPVFDTSKVTNFRGMFNDAGIVTFPQLDLSQGLDFQGMFAYSDLINIPFLDTAKGEIFTWMFVGCNSVCLGGIDTRQQLTTQDMFLNSSFNQPNATDQATIEDGNLWTPSSVCGVEPTGVTWVGGSQTCVIGSIGGSCKSQGQYKVSVDASTVVGALSYNWVSSGNSIVSGQGTDTVTIETPNLGYGANVYVGCSVTDSNKTAYSGTFSFYHSRSSNYLKLELPLHSGVRVLKDFIDLNNPSSLTEIQITNNRTIPPVWTGDLTGLDVTFINNGLIMAYAREDGRVDLYKEKTAFRASSTVTLINNGEILGCGGKGGLGGKGGDDTFTQAKWEAKYHTDENAGSTLGYAWRVRNDVNWVDIWWAGYGGSVNDKNYVGPYTDTNGVSNLTRGILRKTDGDRQWYEVKRKYWESTNRIGGLGGRGGYGSGYGVDTLLPSTWRSGIPGGQSNPTGGNSGGAGGLGGGWGATGEAGKAGVNGAAGFAGQPGGLSIEGTVNLAAGSKIGTIKGATT